MSEEESLFNQSKGLSFNLHHTLFLHVLCSYIINYILQLSLFSVNLYTDMNKKEGTHFQICRLIHICIGVDIYDFVFCKFCFLYHWVSEI